MLDIAGSRQVVPQTVTPSEPSAERFLVIREQGRYRIALQSGESPASALARYLATPSQDAFCEAVEERWTWIEDAQGHDLGEFNPDELED